MKIRNLFFVILLLTFGACSAPMQKAETKTNRFIDPMVDGYAIDICREWGNNCGRPAADAFCIRQGFKSASYHEEKHDAPPTKIITSGKICDEPFCDRITLVVCQ